MTPRAKRSLVRQSESGAGRGLVLESCRRRGINPEPLMAAYREVERTLPGPRDRGRPSMAPYHDLVAFSWLAWNIAGGIERAPRLEPLRRFLEIPELGYLLPKGKIRRIAYSIGHKVANGEALADYPLAASLLRMFQDQAASKPGQRRESR